MYKIFGNLFMVKLAQNRTLQRLVVFSQRERFLVNVIIVIGGGGWAVLDLHL